MTKNASLFIRGIYYAFGLFVLGSALLDTYKYPQSSRKLVGFLSPDLLLLFIIQTFVMRVLWGPPLPLFVHTVLLRFFLPLFALSSIFFTLLDYITPVNYVYSQFYINYDQLGFITITIAAVLVINLDIAFLKKHYRALLFSLAPLSLGVLLLIRLWPQDFFLQIVKEDRFIENTQFIVLLVGAGLSLAVSRVLHAANRGYIATLFTAVSLILLLIAGDEISWGQRLFSFATPETIRIINTQNETNFHNSFHLGGLVGWGYSAIGAYGAFMWIIARVVHMLQTKVSQFVIPEWFVSPYFFAGFFYNFYTLYFTHPFGEWSEVAELMLYLGITLHIATVYFFTSKSS